MATNVTLNGVSYSIPAVGDSNWGTSLSNYLIALPTGVLTKAGGSFPLTAVADFGANFGIKSLYFSSRSTASSAGVIRLGSSEAVGWRNAANSADLLLSLSSDALTFNSNPVLTLANGAANAVLKMNAGGTTFEYGLLANANVDASAAIAYSKLNLATSIVNADISTAAAIAHSKLANITAGSVLLGNGSNVPAATALTGDVTVNSSGVTSISADTIVNADINSAAAIARTKVASGTASHVIINDGSGVLSSEATLAKSRGGTGADNSSVTFPSSGTIVTQSATETLTNKTLATPYVTTGADIESLGATPASPSAGRVRLFVDSGTLKIVNSAGSVTAFGAGLASLNSQSGTNQTFAVGTSGTDFAISSSSNIHTFNIPDAGASARGLVTTGTQTLAGAKTVTSLLTAAAGLTFTGGTAANASIWFASNVLRQRGGTSGWAVDNTSGTAIISATDAGVLTAGPSASNARNFIVNGSARLTHHLEVVSTNITNEASKGVVDFTTSGSQGMRFLSYGASAGTAGEFRFIQRSSDGSVDITSGSVSNAGAVTLGPASGTTTVNHLINSYTSAFTYGNTSLTINNRNGSNAATLGMATGGVLNSAWYSSSSFPFAVTNSSGTDIGFASSAGAWTLGPAGTAVTTEHSFNGMIRARGNNAAATNGQLRVWRETTTATNYIANLLSNVGSTESTQWRVEADGDTISSTGSYTSDIRAKKDVAPIHYGLAEVLQLNPIAYRWNHENPEDVVSFSVASAQQMQEVMPELVRDDGLDAVDAEGNKFVAKAVYEKEVMAVLVKAIQELNAKVEALEAQIAQGT